MKLDQWVTLFFGVDVYAYGHYEQQRKLNKVDGGSEDLKRT